MTLFFVSNYAVKNLFAVTNFHNQDVYITIRKYQKHFRMKHVLEALQTLRKNLAHK